MFVFVEESSNAAIWWICEFLVSVVEKKSYFISMVYGMCVEVDVVNGMI